MKVKDINIHHTLKYKGEWFKVASVTRQHIPAWNMWHLSSVTDKEANMLIRLFEGEALETEIEGHGFKILDDKYKLLK